MSDVRIELTCPGCNSSFFVSPLQQGKIAECPSCGGWVDVPEFTRPPSAEETDDAVGVKLTREWEQQNWEAARQLQIGAEQLEQSQRALDLRDKQDERFDTFLSRAEEVISRWEQLAQRMDRVIRELERRMVG